MSGKQFSASVVIEGIDKASAPIRNVTRALEALGKTEAFTRLNKSFGNVNKQLQSVGYEAGLLATRFAGLGLAAVGVFAAFIKPASELENLRYRLDKVCESTDKGGEAFDKITKFAVKSPYSFNALADSFANLKAQGLDSFTSFENIENYLGAMVPDAYRASNAVDAIAKAWGRGKMSAREGNQLISAGVPIYKLLGQVLGKTRAQLDQMSKKGKITHEVLEKVFNLMAKKALLGGSGVGDLFSTKLSNLGDAWDLFAYKVMNTKLGDISLFGQIKKDMDKLQEFLNTGFSGKAGKEVAQNLSDVYDVAKGLGAVFMEVAPQVIALWNGFKQLTGGTQNAIKVILGFMGIPLVASVFSLIGSIGGLITTFVGWIGTTETAWAALGLGIAIFDGIGAAIAPIIAGVGALVIALGWPAVALLAIAAIAAVVIMNWDTVSSWFTNFFKSIGDWCNWMGEKIASAFQPPKKELWSPFETASNFKSFGAEYNLDPVIKNKNLDWKPSGKLDMTHGGMAPPIQMGRYDFSSGSGKAAKKDTLEVHMKIDIANGDLSILNTKNSGDSKLKFFADMGLVTL